jgi:hypothetical protein
MNRIITTIFLLLCFQLSFSQNETVDKMRAQVSEMIDQISDRDTFTLTIFKDNMVPIELLRKSADAPELGMSDKNKAIIKAIKRADYNKLLKEDHDAIIADANKHNINWKKIKFVDLLYKSKGLFKFSQPGFESLLIFKDKSQKDILFTLRVDFIMLGTDPYILEMDDLKKQLK